MADAIDTIATLPREDDWYGWAEVLTQRDTGTIDCVPECLRPLVIADVGEDGRLIDPGIFPGTPYGVAKFMLADHPLPWRGTGLLPQTVYDLLSQGIPPESIIEVARREAAKTPKERYVVARTGLTDLYFIRSETGPIKIGISVDPTQRLRNLQTAHPHKLELICVIAGGGGLEAEYHKRFAAHRLTGEWFAPHPDILAEIERISIGGM